MFNTIHTQQDHFFNLIVLVFKFINYLLVEIKTARNIWNEIMFVKENEMQCITNRKQLKMFNRRWKTLITFQAVSHM